MLEEADWFLLTIYSKERQQRGRLSKKEAAYIHIAKNEKGCSKSVAEQPFDKEISVGGNHGFNQLSQQKTGRETG